MVKLTLNEFRARAAIVHKNKYDYSKFIYVNSKTKGMIICPIHGEFLQIPNAHLIMGCDLCGQARAGIRRRISSEEFVRKSMEKHGDVYNYSDVKYINAHKKVIIICTYHGEFLQNPHNHLLGKGCPQCRVSKGERKIIQFLSNNKIEYMFQKTFPDCRNPKTNYKLKFDFYIPNKNLLIEYDGQQHFIPGYIGGNYFTDNNDLQELQFRDNIKTSYASKNNINFLRINYQDFSNIESILQKHI